MCRRLFTAAVLCVCVSSATAQDEDSSPSTAREYVSRAHKHEAAQRYDQAIADLTKAIELDPRSTGAYFSRSSLYAEHKQNYRKAVDELTKLLNINPRDYSASFNRGLYYEYLGETDRALTDYTRALDPLTDYSHVGGSEDEMRAHAYHYRGRVYQWQKHDYAQAVADYTEALRLDPSIEMVRYRRGCAFHSLKKYREADQDFAAALEHDPDYPNLLIEWAWQLATCPDETYRDGAKAVLYAGLANETFKRQIPHHVDVLAAAYAENGQFDEAVASQKEAIKLLKGKNDKLQKAMEARLALYEAKQPFREE